nr:immunoglobulin light chain junction region [Macaca mulatta]MOY04976.1 immunoglobulin light chain junction region [Macaca mulatta]MOY04985.1 immunoglobulin light chain junction region [Macaca mulatta]MOY04996.1 immunoglobulin light chain junction region [Macaca mulatta]MOY05040.1 immunoglobulin light chain junction region [Macaca mulatta]
DYYCAIWHSNAVLF